MNISYITGGEEFLDNIKELWESLNKMHFEKATHFKEHFRNNTFAERKEGLLLKASTGSLYVVIAQNENNKNVGYSACSIVNKVAEIDSIYVALSHRKYGVGSQLMNKSLQWIKGMNPTKVLVSVAAGNEEAFGFYKKFGLYPRVTELQMNQDAGT